MDDLDIITLAEAGELLGRSASTLRNQVKAGRLRARLIGKTWVTTRDEVERYRRESLGQPGRPRGVPDSFRVVGTMAELKGDPSPCPACAELRGRLFDPNDADAPTPHQVPGCTSARGCTCHYE